MRRGIMFGTGCVSVLMGIAWLLCSIYTNLSRDGYGVVLLTSGFYMLWIWLGGICFIAAGGEKKKTKKWVVLFCFLGYIYLLARFTLFEPTYNRELRFLWTVSAEERIRYLRENINPKPFQSVKLFCRAIKYEYLPLSTCIANLLGNFVVFMPMPLFFLFFLRRKNIFLAIVFTGISIVFIEFAQLLTMCGSMDIDDFILNLSGALCSGGLLKHFWRNKRQKW